MQDVGKNTFSSKGQGLQENLRGGSGKLENPRKSVRVSLQKKYVEVEGFSKLGLKPPKKLCLNIYNTKSALGVGVHYS